MQQQHTETAGRFEEPGVAEDGGLSAIKGDPDVMGLMAPLRLVSSHHHHLEEWKIHKDTRSRSVTASGCKEEIQQYV